MFRSRQHVRPDVFVSYAHADDADGFVQSLVEAIKEELSTFSSATSDVIFLDKAGIETMDDWENNILSALRSSRYLLAIVSPNYFLSPFCRREWREFTRLGSEEALSNILGECATIYIEPCPPFDASERLSAQHLVTRIAEIARERGVADHKVPSTDASIVHEFAEWVAFLRRPQYEDLGSAVALQHWREKGIEALKDEIVRERLRTLSQRISQVSGRAAARARSPNTVPAHNPDFVGRVEELRTIRDTLAVTEREGTIAVLQSAFGGIGKSAIAFEYAHVFGPEYPGGRFLVPAAGVSDLSDAFLNLAIDLGDDPGVDFDLPETDRSAPERAFRRLRAWLQDGGPRLLVFDNVDDPRIFARARTHQALPDADRVHILATTRLERDKWPAAGRSFRFIPVEPLPVDRGADLLARLREPEGEDEWAAARAIATDLAGHPFSLEVVGAFLGQDSQRATTYRGFYEHKIKGEGLTLSLDAAGSEVPSLSGHDETVISRLLDTVFETLAEDERLILDYAALMDPDQVVLPWLRALAGRDHPHLVNGGPAGLASEWDRRVARLAGLRLLTPQDRVTRGAAGEQRLARLHRVLGAVLRHKAADRIEPLEKDVLALAHRIENDLQDLGRVDLRWQIGPLLALALALLGRPSATESKTGLLVKTANCFWGTGEVLRALEAYAEAERLYRRLVEKERRTELANDLAGTLSNKGEALRALGRSGEALEACAEAERILRRLVEEEDRTELANDLAMTLNKKGIALAVLGRAGEALEACAEAERIQRRLLEKDRRTELADDLAGTLNNKGNALQDLGRAGEALEATAEAERIRRRLVEEEGHTELADDLAMTLTNKGNALRALGRAGQALEACAEAERIHRRLVEDEGRSELVNDLARTLTNKGVALQAVGRAGEALEAYAEAERIYRRLVEDESRPELANDLAGTLTSKGAALRALGRAGEALEAHAEAERIHCRLVEEEGRTELANDLARTLTNKGNALRALGRAGEALEAYAEAERIWRHLVKEEGRTGQANDLAMTLTNKGNALWALRRAGEALEAYAEAERLYRGLVEEEGRTELANDLARTRHDLASLLAACGKGRAAKRIASLIPPLSDEAAELRLRAGIWCADGPLVSRRLWCALGLAAATTALALTATWAALAAVPLGLISGLFFFGVAQTARRRRGSRNVDLRELEDYLRRRCE